MENENNDIISEEIEITDEESEAVIDETLITSSSDEVEEIKEELAEETFVMAEPEETVVTEETVIETTETIVAEEPEEVPVQKKKPRHGRKDDDISVGRQIFEGLLTKNVILTQAVGLCPLLALSVTVKYGLYISLIATVILIVSNIVISLSSRIISERVRIPIFLIIITGIVTILKMLLDAFLPDISMSLGLYIPLIAVDSMILLRADGYARNHSLISSAFDGLATGLGFTLVMLILSIIRELLGSGSILGITILPENFPYFTVLLLPVGGFLLLGAIAALFKQIFNKKQKGTER